MKFSEFDRETWPALAPYLDTCLLPVTGLRGGETPDVMTDKAAAAGAWLSPVEQAFKGRTVTLPAHHYYDGGKQAQDNLNALCDNFRRVGFRYVVLVCGAADLLGKSLRADLILQPASMDETPDSEALRMKIVDLWQGNENNSKEWAASGQAGGE